MDDVSNYNRERWNALVRANALFTRPAFHLDATTARQRIDPEGLLGELAGKRVLCLAWACTISILPTPFSAALLPEIGTVRAIP